MPLSEFLRMARGKLESARQKTSCPTDLSPGPENNLVELVWENGQIMMQGQSNRAKKSPCFNDIPSQTPVIRDKHAGNGSSPKFGKFGGVESILEDAAPSVPTGEISLSQDDEMVAWLNYPMDVGYRQDFCSELLPEVSGVTGNEPSTQNSFAAVEKRNCGRMVGHSHIVPVHNGANMELQNAPKVSSSRTGLVDPYSSLQGQISVPSLGSGMSDTVMNTKSHKADVSYGDSVQGQSSAGGLVSMKMEKQNLGSSGNGFRLLNFSHFSRPAALFKANLQKTDDGLTASCSSGVEKMVNEEKVPASSSGIRIKSMLIGPSSNSIDENGFHNQPNLVSSKVDSRPEIIKPLEEACPAEGTDAACREDSIKNDNSPSQAIGASSTKGLTDGQKSGVPVAASSVCSGNSAERTSNDQTHNSKRKYRDNDESESRSEDIEEESAGVKRPTSARGGSGSKRSRAAEVHNLSERRRRDRINEKMRALQELIPNCNKADKASMLDEAIEYLKTLQLQVQIMSMGAGMCMPPMMFPTGLQHMHAAHMPHFAPMGSGMGVGMGFGMGMLDMTTGSPRFPIFPVTPLQGAHFPSPPISGSSTFPGIGGSNLQVFGHPGQGLAMPVPRAPFVPLMRQAPLSSTVGLDASRMGVESLRTSPVYNHDVAHHNKNLHVCQNAHASSSHNQTSAQLPTTKDAFDQPASTPKDDQVRDACADTSVNLISADVSRKEGGE